MPNFVEAKCANICIVLSLEFRVEIVNVFNRSEIEFNWPMELRIVVKSAVSSSTQIHTPTLDPPLGLKSATILQIHEIRTEISYGPSQALKFAIFRADI